MSEGAVRYERDGVVGRITFDRPAARNAMTWTMYDELARACEKIAADSEVRVAVLRGAGGKAFVAGTDIGQFRDFKSGEDGVDYERRVAKYLAAVEELPVPSLAVVEGWAIGGGLAIAAACDLRVATPGSRFGVPIARTLGNCLSIANYACLAAELGLARTKRMLLLAEMLAAEELLAAGFLAFVVAVLVCLARAPRQNRTVGSMWLVLASLLVAVVFGLMLASLFGWGIALPNQAAHSLHPGWSLLGWTGLLVTGMGFELVPMLQMTAQYPKPMARYMGALLLALLALWSAALWIDEGRWGEVAVGCAVATAAAYALFAVVTVVLQQRRRRRLADVTLDFWRVGMLSLFGASLAWGIRVAWPGAWAGASPESMDILIGVLAMFGFAGSVISGMLYKIMPFLAWFHLQSMCGPGVLAPNMKKILPDARQRLQFRSQVLALALLCAAALWPGLFVYPAALALAATAVLLEMNLLAVVRAYRDGRARAASQSAPRDSC